jgi:putative ABC transport system permease protein
VWFQQLLEESWRDLRHGLRTLARNPGFTCVSVLTLALGIGLNTAVFSTVEGVLLRPLPFESPDRLVQVWESSTQYGGQGPASVPNLEDWREQNQVFERLVAYRWSSRNLQDAGYPERIDVVECDTDLFGVLGATPQLGRTFAAGEGEPGKPAVAVLSEAFWKQKFGADRAALGRDVLLDGEPYTVIGVMPEDFQFPFDPGRVALWVPLRLSPPERAARDMHFLPVVGRLKPGVKLEQARFQMQEIARRIEQQHPIEQADRTIRLTPLHEEVVGGSRQALLVLFGAVGLVLLIACANVANLLLARTAGRTHEIAIRIALGAARARLVRQHLFESVLLSGLGGLVGSVVAFWGTDLLVALAGDRIPRSGDVRVDAGVLGFLLLASLVTGIGFGIAPALFASRTDVQQSLKAASTRGQIGTLRRKYQNALAVSEIALALVLLAGAGLLVNAFVRLQRVETGLVSDNVLTMRMSLPEKKYPGGSAWHFYHQVLERVHALPGVRAAGFITRLPLQSWGWNGGFVIEGAPEWPQGSRPLVEFRLITPAYFRALGIPVLKGRAFTDQDGPATLPVVLINHTLARRYFADVDPVGRRIKTPGASELFDEPKTRWLTIVGVVGDVKNLGLHRSPRAEIYFNYSQVDRPRMLQQMSLVTSTRSASANLAGDVRSAIQSVDPTQPVYDVKTMETVIADSLSGRRFNLWVLGGFAALALSLAMAGVYGVLSCLVAQRTQEFGVRIALGARPVDILRTVLMQGIYLALSGILIGVAASWALTRFLASLLYAVSPTDPFTFACASVTLFLMTLLACYVPARRATKVDPMVALRYE